MTDKKTYTEDEVNAMLQEKAQQQVQANFNINCVKELRIAITVLRKEGYSEARYLEAMLVELSKPQQVPAVAPRVEEEKGGEEDDGS